jgi:hypothetical protein
MQGWESMSSASRKTYSWFAAVGCLAVLLFTFAAKAGSFLIVESPQPSDAILVLAGETDLRPRRAIELLKQGYTKRIVLDVPTNSTLYEFAQIELAERYIHDLHLEEASAGGSSQTESSSATSPVTSMIVCPITGLSTKEESRDAENCLQRVGAKSVLIVTSDFHTRRALEIFRHELPQHQYSAAATRNPQQFGSRWWTRRQWAKVCVDEWLRLFWWQTVDRWRR